MRNTLEDLQNHLFAQLERLGDEELDEDGLSREIERAKAIGEIGKVAITNANTAMSAVRMRAGLAQGQEATVPRMLGGGDE